MHTGGDTGNTRFCNAWLFNTLCFEVVSRFPSYKGNIILRSIMASTTFVDYSASTPIVAAWLNDVNSAIYGAGLTRPIATFVGQVFFDTSLGQPIWCLSPSPLVWVNAAGAQV
jgi:hypothetical protein